MTLFDPTAEDSYYFAVWSRTGQNLNQGSNTPRDLRIPERPGRDTQIQFRDRQGNRECFQFTELGDCVLAGVSLDRHNAQQRRQAWAISGAALIVLALGLGGGGFITARALQPLEEIAGSARRISSGNLSERIETRVHFAETNRLAEVLNHTFEKLQLTFARMEQFTADTAHELRTPLAVLISEGQTILARQRSNEDYRASIRASLETAQQMRKLTDSLLELALLDSHEGLSQFESVDLDHTILDALKLVRPLAEERMIDLEYESCPAALQGNSDQLSRLITNLLSNAIYYNRNHGSVRVVTKNLTDSITVSVTDTGIGIPSDEIEKIFDRCYRVDRARTKDNDRTGLGLAISRAIAQAHGGDITVSSRPDIGSTFFVSLPHHHDDATKQ